MMILGGGPAGCEPANRLSASRRRSVLLIEAGMDTPPETTPPEILDSYPMLPFFGDKYIWPGLSTSAAATSSYARAGLTTALVLASGCRRHRRGGNSPCAGGAVSVGNVARLKSLGRSHGDGCNEDDAAFTL